MGLCQQYRSAPAWVGSLRLIVITIINRTEERDTLSREAGDGLSVIYKILTHNAVYRKSPTSSQVAMSAALAVSGDRIRPRQFRRCKPGHR
jgi:hypothetical protein